MATMIRRVTGALCCALAIGEAGLALGAEERATHRVSDIAVSPDGQFVAAIEGDSPSSGREPVVRDLVIRRTDGSAMQMVELPCGRVPECWPSSPTWAPDSKRLAFALRTPGSHARALYSVEAGGAGLTQLLAFDGTIIQLRYGPDARLAMLATASATKEVGATQAGAAVVGDLAAPTPEQRIAILQGEQLQWVSPPELFVYEYDWRPDGQGFVGTAAPGDGDNNWWSAKLYAFETAHTARLLYQPRDARLQLTQPRVSPDGQSVLFIGGLMSDFGASGGDLYRVPLSGGAAQNLTQALHATVTEIGFNCQGQPLLKLLAAEQTQIVTLDGAAAATPAAQRPLWSGEDSLSGRDAGVSFGCPSQVTATVRENFGTPPEIFVGALGDWHALTSFNAGLSLPATVRSITWKSEGFNVQGWLLLPQQAKQPLPLITSVHGGPAAAWTAGFVGPGISRALLNAGYAIFMPNPRGSFGQGEAFTQANVRDLGHGDLRDIQRGIDAVARAAPIDQSRLGVMGTSYGGYFSMWAITQTQRFKAAVAVAGISDWLSYYGENGIDGWLLPYFGASVYADPKIYARSSPINFIRNVHTPTLAYVGANDIECPAPQTQEFWHALQELGVPSAIVIYPQEGHGLRDPVHQADAQQRVINWFNRYLKQ